MSLTIDRAAQTDAPILDVLAERWSTRIFDAEAPIDEAALASALEAARWAPSAANTQPTRFILARRGTPEHATIVDALMGFNQEWAGAASVLLVVLAETVDDEGAPRRWGAYDAGQSAAHFTVQAHASGLATHQMGGFVVDTLRASFDLDPRLDPLTVIAVGPFGDPDRATEALRERDSAPRTRRPIAESLIVDA